MSTQESLNTKALFEKFKTYFDHTFDAITNHSKDDNIPILELKNKLEARGLKRAGISAQYTSFAAK